MKTEAEIKQHVREWELRNKRWLRPEAKKRNLEYARKNKEKLRLQCIENWKKRPWLKTLARIRSRCLNKAHHYYKRGIKNYLVAEEVKFLWFRDKAYMLKEPSLDRRDSKGNYILENCRYIELKDNLNYRRSKVLCG